MLKYIREAGELYRLSFGDENRRRMDRSVAWLFCVFIVVFLPHSFLAKFSNQFVIDLLGQRTENDYLYLLANNPEFADAYIGGITIQIAILTLAILIPLYLIITSRKILFFTDVKTTYVFFLFLICITFGGAVYLLFGITDFGFHAAGVSWFEDNELRQTKWLPAPQTSTTLIATGLFLTGVTFAMLGCVQFLKILISGKRVRYQDRGYA